MGAVESDTVIALRNLVLPATAGVGLLALWEAVWRARVVDPLFFSGPSAIVVRLWQLMLSGEILGHYWMTIYSAGIGLVVALALAVPVGILYGLWPGLRNVTAPYFAALNVMPRVALIPLLIIWFGLGLTTRVVMVALSAFFPIFFNTVEGVHGLDPSLDRAGRVFGCTPWERVRLIVLPAALPHIFIGMRLAIGRGLIVIVVAEIFVGSLGGIGYFIITAGQNFHAADIFASALLLAATGLVLTWAIERLGALLSPWHEQTTL